MPRANLKKKILVIEDNQNLLNVLVKKLSKAGYDVYGAHDDKSGLESALKYNYSLIISDIYLPEYKGFEIIKTLRQADVRTPAIIITDFSSSENEKQTFLNGANIFHKKPIDYDLLIVQANFLINSFQFKPEINIGDILVEPEKRIFKKNGELIELTRKEFDLMLILLSSPGEVFSRREILNKISNHRMEAEERSVDLLVFRLRKLLGTYKGVDVIETVREKGFRLNLTYLT